MKVQAAIQGETLFEGVMPPAGEKVTSDVHPYFAYEIAPNTLEQFTLGTVTGEGILKKITDLSARRNQKNPTGRFFDFFQFSIDNCITGAIIKTNI